LSSNPPQTLQQFIETQKIQYSTQKGVQASNEYVAITTPFVHQIISLQRQLKVVQEKLPKKQRVKIIKQGKK
jgi:hypothetical protein